MGGSRPLASVVSWRSEKEWREVYDAFRLVDPNNSIGWRRGRPGHHDCWEEALVLVHGMNWTDALETEYGRLDWRRLSKGFAN
eukprot:6410060-Lingulodinium_polyedra.AAC.1